MTPGTDRAGVMVVRIWIEGSSGSLRARMTQTLDITTHDHASELAVTAEQILNAVQEWIEAFIAQVG